MPLFGKSNVSSEKAGGNKVQMLKARVSREQSKVPVVETLMMQTRKVVMALSAVA